MAAYGLKDRILAELDSMNDVELEQVLRLMRSSSMVHGRGATAGELLNEFGGSISNDELDRMERAIEEGCERIDQE